ncbi:MAG: hypothetical protein C4527_19300 [Candidatus Omnitrophota bacterium]|jgi:hypothetical protein|nr:MAG: hypothetical protein C4527_19300 [Candidatus Omnitrophota bacterium]
MTDLRSIYLEKALSQIPRLLSSQDRNRFSPTYGCMNREFWLCRATDFPSSIAQFGVHALALVYAHEMPGNRYYHHPKMLEWTLAGMEYWTRIQHQDGSFDEFYPNERGWAGPTGFLLYAMCESYRLVEKEIPGDLKECFLKAVHQAAMFLSRTDESGVLANHHAMAILPMYKAFLLVGDRKIESAFKEKLDIFLGFCHEEGWCLEYDGADPGYLSASISFMAKLSRHYRDDRFSGFFEKAVEFSSYFVYPNGYYGGTIGSRQTLHFYPHGYELLTKEIPLAASVANRMLLGLQAGALVPPEIQGERYFVYRIPEFLLAYLDYGDRPETPPLLPYERETFRRFFPGAKMLMVKTNAAYTVVNAAKGGVVKHFSLSDGKLVVNNCGIVGQLKDGRVFTSQWIDDNHGIEQEGDELRVKGRCHKVPSKVFSPLTFIIFRIAMLLFGWHERIAYYLKGWIRKLLMLGGKPMPVRFERVVRVVDQEIEVNTMVELLESAEVVSLQFGDEFPARYVPQSRYFQFQELDVRGYVLRDEELKQLNATRRISVRERYRIGDTESFFDS